jgi:hypothetical protein
MIENIDELPIWTDCPFRHRVPAEYTIRKGEGIVSISYEVKDTVIWHCDIAESSITERDYKDAARIMVNQLVNMRLENEFPGVYPGIVKRQAEFVLGTQDALSDVDQRYLARQEELRQ